MNIYDAANIYHCTLHSLMFMNSHPPDNHHHRARPHYAPINLTDASGASERRALPRRSPRSTQTNPTRERVYKCACVRAAARAT